MHRVALLLAALLLLPLVAAEAPEEPIVVVTATGPQGLVTPNAPTITVPVRVEWSCSRAEMLLAPTESQRVDVRVVAAPPIQAHLSLGAGTAARTSPTQCDSDALVHRFETDFTLKLPRRVRAFDPLPVRIFANVTQDNVTGESWRWPATHRFDVRPDYVPGLDVAPKANYVTTYGEPVNLSVEVRNIGNGAANVSFAISDRGAGYDVTAPAPVTLGVNPAYWDGPAGPRPWTVNVTVPFQPPSAEPGYHSFDLVMRHVPSGSVNHTAQTTAVTLAVRVTDPSDPFDEIPGPFLAEALVGLVGAGWAARRRLTGGSSGPP